MNLVVTAGFDGSTPALALCELLRRSGHWIDSVLVVTPYNPARLRKMLRQRGIKGLKKLLIKLFNKQKSGIKLGSLAQFMTHEKIPYKSLKSWCKSNGAKYVTVTDLNSSRSINTIKKVCPDAVIYAGGGILHSPFIEAANHKIINNHSGPLPEVRGMNAIEWSIMLGYEPSITVHFIERGIDTGKIISRKRVPVMKGDSIEDIRDRAIISGILEITKLFNGLSDLNELKIETKPQSFVSRQCYIMAPAVRELLSDRLKVPQNGQ